VNHLSTTLAEFIRDLKAQKLRAFLTTFGIVWGTVAIIILVAFGIGFKQQLGQTMHGIGERIAIMFPGKTTKAWQGFVPGRELSFTEEDTKLLATQIAGLKVVTPEYSKREIPVRVGINVMNPLVTGCYPEYSDIRNVIPERGGRFLNTPDEEERRRVVVIGDKVKEILFGDSKAVGNLVSVGGIPFTVIGVMQHKTQNSSYNSRDASRIFIPATTFASIYGEIHINNILYTPKDPRESESLNQQVREVLAKKYKFDPADKDAVWIWDTTEFDKFLFYFFLAFNIFMGIIGSFTLGVAGIGVANIMFIVVQERVREIGIKRAVGAKKTTIMSQFFMETFFIVAFGSSIGFLIALGIVQLLQFIPIKEFVGTPKISWEVVVTTITVLSAIGLSAGMMPAKKAANLDVVECLR
jgi:putative ABC transport system permease protein